MLRRPHSRSWIGAEALVSVDPESESDQLDPDSALDAETATPEDESLGDAGTLGGVTLPDKRP
jgi:hypothetical protein